MATARMALEQYEDAAVAAFEGLKLDDENYELKKIMKTAIAMGRKENSKGKWGEGWFLPLTQSAIYYN